MQHFSFITPLSTGKARTGYLGREGGALLHVKGQALGYRGTYHKYGTCLCGGHSLMGKTDRNTDDEGSTRGMCALEPITQEPNLGCERPPKRSGI